MNLSTVKWANDRTPEKAVSEQHDTHQVADHSGQTDVAKLHRERHNQEQRTAEIERVLIE